jgi:predicted transcriptional regulator of viral defense system
VGNPFIKAVVVCLGLATLLALPLDSASLQTGEPAREQYSPLAAEQSRNPHGPSQTWYEHALSLTHYNVPLKTVGRQTARLLSALYDRPQSTFTLDDVEKVTGLSASLASSLLHKAVARGLVSRLKPGLFVIVPPELGSSTEYAGDPYLTAMRLAGDAPCFISHASAMEIHRMVTQPQLVVFASCSKRIRSRKLHGTEFRFVFIKGEHYFGTMQHWVTKQEAVTVSDLERTVIDGLRQPEYCGGVTEVAKGLWMRHRDIQASKLVDYALRLGVGAVCRRLGYLLELYAIAPESEVARLRESLTATYDPLDPMLPKEGPHVRRWRLQLNITAQELEAVRAT